MGHQQFCTEARVREIAKEEVSNAVVSYERLINRIDGGVTTLKWIGSTALVFCALCTAYFAYHNHH